MSMAISYMDYTSPDLQFFFDVNKSNAFFTNSKNYINILGYKQLNTLGNASILDIFMSKGHYVEPHYHQNATELVYCVSGKIAVSFINPFTNKLYNIPITPGQVANVPQGWWHYEQATEDNTHVVAIFDAPMPEVILGSDILRLTPPKVFADTYCLDEAKWKEAVAPITKTVGIGPLDSCGKTRADGGFEALYADEPEQNPYQGYGSPPISEPYRAQAAAYAQQQPYVYRTPPFPYAPYPASPYQAGPYQGGGYPQAHQPLGQPYPSFPYAPYGYRQL